MYRLSVRPLLRLRQETADPGGQHRSVQVDELASPPDHHRVLRSALVPEIPDQLQSTAALLVDLVEFVEQYGARALIDKFTEC